MVFFQKDNCFQAKIWLFLTFGAVIKDTKSKRNFHNNHGHSILRLFLCFTKLFFATSETDVVIINNKTGIYEWIHELPNHLRLCILENMKISGKL